MGINAFDHACSSGANKILREVFWLAKKVGSFFDLEFLTFFFSDDLRTEDDFFLNFPEMVGDAMVSLRG